jgi:hypothetical protein
MKHLTVVLALLLVCSASFAGIPGKTEFTFSGSYVNPDDGKATWNVGFEPLFPMGTGVLVIGPSAVVSDNDVNTGAGATLEVNVPGQSGGFFFGGQALYYLDSEDGQDDHTTSARAGLKLPISQSGLFKVYVQKGLSGRDRDNDLSGVLAAVIKF